MYNNLYMENKCFRITARKVDREYVFYLEYFDGKRYKLMTNWVLRNLNDLFQLNQILTKKTMVNGEHCYKVLSSGWFYFDSLYFSDLRKWTFDYIIVGKEMLP